ncbi:MAG: hypothetical protein HKN92_06820, partial [Chitinophagales bacterium]|nr:hypothetical protein [Chitinophagales bacterium]
MNSARLVLFFLVFASFSAYAQDDDGQIILKDSSYLKKKDIMKQYEYENFQSPFKAKKKSQWAIGLLGGPAYIAGDINPQLGWGLGMNAEKAIGHLVSLRMQALYSENRGIDWENNHNHLSYLTTLTDVNAQVVFNINNINFYKRQPSTIFYIFAGVGMSTTKTRGDVLDENGNPYNFSVINEATSGCIFCPSDEVGRSDVRQQLNELMDNRYESTENRAATDLSIGSRIVHPTFLGGAGIRYRLNEKFDIHLEHRFSFHSDDLLDGTNKQNNSGNISQGTDIWQFTNIGISWKIGKRAESLYWANPLYSPLDDIRALKETLDEGNFFQDEDEDGVLDQFDLDGNTPPRVAVNTKGVALDSDNDGIPDYLDKERFTPPGSPIDGNGVALDSDADGVADIFDMESNTPADAFVDIHGRSIK